MPRESEHLKLRRLSRICLALPEAARSIHDDYADFRVRGKVFAYFLNNHNGDGIISVCCKSSMGQNIDRAGREPERFYLPAYIGPRGWFGLRLDRGRIDWEEVANIIELSYSLAAPKTLVRSLENMGETGTGKAKRRKTSGPATRRAPCKTRQKNPV